MVNAMKVNYVTTLNVMKVIRDASDSCVEVLYLVLCFFLMSSVI
jgi:hypothetical protein